MTSRVKFIDLFAGIGGMRVAAEQLGFECVFTSEIDQAARETYAKNFKLDETEIFGDVSEAAQDPQLSIPDHDLLLGGFPCQPFSRAGRRLGFQDRTRGTLFFSVAQIISAKRPRAILLENVRGLLSHDRGNTISVIRETLEELRYEVVILKLNARDYGLPQNRERVFIVGQREDYAETYPYVPPTPTHDRGKLRVGDVLDAPTEDLYISDRIWISHQERRRRHEEAGRGFGYQLFTRDSSYVATISARYGKDGSEVLIDERDARNPRKLSSREALRLQGFPEDFLPHSSYTQATKQAGNAVPIPVVTAVLAQLHL